MATTFENNLTEFGDYPKYVKSLRKAVAKVKQDAQPPMDFLYFKAYAFADGKVRPLVLVDFNEKFKTALKTEKKLTATAEGTVGRTPKEELDFVATRGSVKRVTLKGILDKMGDMPGVFVVAGEVENGADDAGVAQQAQPQAKESLPVGKVAPKPLPKPPSMIPADLKLRIETLRDTRLNAQGEANKQEILKRALTLAMAGKRDEATQLLDALARTAVPKPLPKPPLGQADESGEGGFDDDESSEEVVLDSPAAKKAALPPSASVAAAQQQLAAEEAAFARKKTIAKSNKIKEESTPQGKALKKEKEEKEAKKEARKLADADKSWFDKRFGKKSGEKPTAQEEQREKDRIEIALANEKLDKEIKKYTGKPLDALGRVGQAQTAAAEGFDKVLASDNLGDNIAGAAGTVATSLAGVASSMAKAGREFVLYRKTRGAQRTVHLNKTTAALGEAFASLVSLTKGTITIADTSGAMEAGSAVPILGIVAAVPSLLAEINHLRSAITRLAKQQKVYFALEEQIEKGDASQTALFATVSTFMARDTSGVAKGIAKVTFDFTKIAGHAVTCGGITGPVGVALVSVAAAGKLAISAVSGVQGLVAANRANDRRKKLAPTLNAAADWKKLPKTDADAPEMTALTVELRKLGETQKGSKEHAQLLERLVACAEKVKQARPDSKVIGKFTTELIDNAKKEQLAWKDGAADKAPADEQEDEEPTEEAPQARTAEDPHQRNARKLIQQDPQVAAQVLIDQAMREGPPGGPAFKMLKSFGIKGSQLYSDVQGDDKIANIQEIRQKVLFKLGADDESAKTMTQTLRGAKQGVVNYFSMGTKHEELDKYLQAKDLLNHRNKSRRSEHKTMWKLKMDILTDDVEEKKEALRDQVEYLIETNDIDADVAREVIELLRPRHESA